MAQEFYNYLKAHAEKAPDHPAIIDGEVTLTYGQLLESVEKFSGALSHLQLGPQSKLGILCLNQKEYLIAYLAALMRGLPAVPFNFILDPEDLVFIARDAGIDTLVVDSAFAKPESAKFFQLFKHKILAGEGDLSPLGDGAVRFQEFLESGNRKDGLKPHSKDKSIPSVILYTSGTTARPKGVMLDESQFDINISSV